MAEEYARVADTSEVPDGAGLRVVVKGKRIALFNVDGTYYAISDVCSHEEASLAEGEILGEIVECPRHGARFNVKTGRALSLPAIRGVATYPVKVERNEIKIAVK